jgi:hypothetical protein
VLRRRPPIHHRSEAVTVEQEQKQKLKKLEKQLEELEYKLEEI